MAAYSTSLPNVSPGGYTGTIEVTIATTEGGGDPVNYTVDLVVSVQNAGYNFTGGNPPVGTTFGNNGARWDDITFSSGQTRTVTYNWSKSITAGSDYVVMLLGDDGPFHVHWGTLPPALSTP
jgi:hypothetical protein